MKGWASAPVREELPPATRTGALARKFSNDLGVGYFYCDPATRPFLSRLRGTLLLPLRGILLPRRLASVESWIGGRPSARLESAGWPEPAVRLDSESVCE